MVAASHSAVMVGEGPWVIDPRTPEDERSRLLDAIARVGEEDPTIRRVAAEIAHKVRFQRGARREQYAADMALAYVQELPWFDPFADERYKAVSRTLREGGNCHDKSPVLVALLHRLGIPSARNVWLTQKDAGRNHVLVTAQLDGVTCRAGTCARDWCWAETTVDGARFCEDPYDAARRTHSMHNGLQPKARVPADVRAPEPRGQNVMESIKVKTPILVTTQPAPLVAVNPVRVVTAAPLPPLLVPVRRGFARAARKGKPSGCACNIGLARAMVKARAERRRSVVASGSVAADPCAGAWSGYYAARAAFAINALRYPLVGVSLRRSDGRAMSQPTGAATPWTAQAWLAIGPTGHRDALYRAVLAWAARLGVATLDTGVLSDWLNVATIALDRDAEALGAAAQAALDGYARCRRAGYIDTDAVVATTRTDCAGWTALPPSTKVAAVRTYLAGAGYDIHHSDATVMTLVRAVDAACSRVQVVAQAPRGALPRLAAK